MAVLTAEVAYQGKQNADIVLRPSFNKEVAQLTGITVNIGTKSKIKLNFWGRIRKILLPYVKGFQGGTSVDIVQKELVLKEFKAEMSYEKHDYFDTIQYEMVNIGGMAQNDITGTAVAAARVKLFIEGVKDDVYRLFWLGDTAKTHINDGTYPGATPVAYEAGDPDKYYNHSDGVLKSIKASILQSYTQRHTLISGWDKSTVPILYLVESSGTVYAYATAAKRTGAQAGDKLFHFTATNSSYPAFMTVTADNTSGFGGKVQLLKAVGSGETFEIRADEKNFIKKFDLASTLASDDAEEMFKTMISNANPELKKIIEAGEARFYVTDEVYYNYRDTLTASGTLESARKMLIEGVSTLMYDGIPLIRMNIDSYIQEDFASDFPQNYIILTTPQNLRLELNGANDIAETRLWFDPNENENRARTQFEFAMDWVLPEIIEIAY